MKFGIHGFSGSLMMNSLSDFQNSKWRIQDNIAENVYLGVFGIADYESVIRFSNFKMAGSRWRPPK